MSELVRVSVLSPFTVGGGAPFRAVAGDELHVSWGPEWADREGRGEVVRLTPVPALKKGHKDGCKCPVCARRRDRMTGMAVSLG
jgi:hypothetical protein